MARKEKSVRVVTYISAHDQEDAPIYTDKAELLADIRQIEDQGNLALVIDENGDEIPMGAVISMTLEG